MAPLVRSFTVNSTTRQEQQVGFLGTDNLCQRMGQAKPGGESQFDEIRGHARVRADNSKIGHHGETSSEVTVGSFGDDLLEAAPEVKRLREHFKYALENGRYKWNHLDNKRYRVKPMVVAVPQPDHYPW